MYLSEEQIIELIIEYVKDKRRTQAILIDGDWGSGKTFFVKGKLSDKLEDTFNKKDKTKKSIIYISLYGIKNVQQVMKEIYTSSMETFFDKKIHKGSGETIGKGINIISKIASAGLGYFNISKEDLPNIMELKKLENAVLIFDDLERCNISVNEIFGFINSLVEHNDIKVIIVANQTEIGNMKLTEDLAQKYDIILNENLCLQTDNKKKQHNDDKQQGQNKSISKDELIQYTKKLFSDDILYEKIKEKVIGVTIHYHSDLKNVYESILKKYINDKDVNKYLLNKKDTVIKICENKKHYNIRTLIFAIMAFEKIDILIKEIKFEPKHYINEQREKILKYCVTLSIHLRLGKKPYSWNDNTVKSGNISFDDNYLWGKQIFAYKFIDDYLLYRSFNREEIKMLLIDIMKERKKENEYQSSQGSLTYNSMICWCKLEDDEIRDKLKIILKELEEEKYYPISFKSIIITLMQLKHSGFKEIEIDNYVSKMKTYLERTKEDFKQECMEAYSDDKKFLNEYNQIISPLIKILVKKGKEKKEADINNCFSSKNSWGREFYKFCFDNRENILLDKKFFFYVDIDKLIEKIRKSSVKNLYDLLLGIQTVYSFGNLNDFFKDDIKSLDEVIEKLDIEGLSDKKITKKLALNQIKNKLTKSLELIK